MSDNAQQMREKVQEGYTAVAQTSSCCCGPSAFSGGPDQDHLSAQKLAESIGYDAQQLASLPDGANMGLSCGNPAAISALKDGQVVLDLGSGGGFDVFLAGPKVGSTGRVIGVDMTPAMLSKARTNIEHYTKTTGLSNVEFRLGEIEHLPVADNTIDVVISNCVINLSPDKQQVWREIARVLKPGGIVAASDMALYKPLPPEAHDIAQAFIGCVAGAILIDDYKQMVQDARLVSVILKPKPEYVQALLDSGNELYRKINDVLPDGQGPGDYLTSVAVAAIKPKTCCCSA
ncbi:MAG TPA: arsenite S-adenosylmethyltransferase [Phycisphaerales bacterium]|mgnify:CR=1 FL=1|nr:arsenite S-adenosylmethyltransferase [Phycisphaerales bacterium]|tara:strand:- start:7923 stop:8789 length:867 start_codon:yes stop_codon:yes gene_type:complete